MKRTKKIVSVLLTFTIMLATVSAFAAPVNYGEELTNAPEKTYSQRFSDVPKSYWAFSYIGEMAERGVLSGYPDGKFYPDKNVSRSEFAKIMTVAAGLSISNTGYSSYSDVSANDWCSPYVEAARYYLSGYVSNGQNLYLPESNALREDIAVALVKLKGYDTTGYDLSIIQTMFSDWQSISDGARKYVAVAVEQGLISGYTDGTFRGQAGITRAETATLLWRAYQYGNGNKNFEEVKQTELEKEVIQKPEEPKKEEPKKEEPKPVKPVVKDDEEKEVITKPSKPIVVEEPEEPEVKYGWKVETIKSAIGGMDEILAVPGGVSYRSGNKLYELNENGKRTVIFDADNMEYLGEDELSKNDSYETKLYSYGYNEYDDCYYVLIYQKNDGYLYNVTTEEIVFSATERLCKLVYDDNYIKTPKIEFMKNGDFILRHNSVAPNGNSIIRESGFDEGVYYPGYMYVTDGIHLFYMKGLDINSPILTKSLSFGTDIYYFKSNNIFIANAKVYFTRDGEFFSVDPSSFEEDFILSFDNIQNDEGRKINEYHVSANGTISEDEKTIYFYDEAYDSIRMITKQ